MQWSSLPPAVVAYCGLPPDPASIWSRWRLDPWVIAAMLGLAAAFALAARRLPRPAGRLPPPHAFHLGWALAAAALMSPLCPLSVSLFSARVTQHVVLTLLAAPLVARGLLWLAAPAAAPTAKGRPLAACAAFALCVWFWHAPPVYAATFLSRTVYWTMHLSMFGTALWLWIELLRPAREAAPARFVAGLASTVQMGLLGALIALAPAPLYAPHFLTTDAWGYTPLEDQQLGGVIMWVPGCAAFLVVALIECARLLVRPLDDVRGTPAP